MSVTIQLRRDLAATWIANNPILAQGEIGLEYDTGNLKVGNGVTPWVQLHYPGSPPNILNLMMPIKSSGIPLSSEILGSFVAPQPMTLTYNCSGSFANAGTAATNDSTFNILYQPFGNTTQTTVGTITYTSGSCTGSFSTSGNLVPLNAGDTLYVQAPSTPDATLADIAGTIIIGEATIAISYVAGQDGTYAFFALANNSTTTNLYNYAAKSTQLGTSLSITTEYGITGTGNSTVGVFAFQIYINSAYTNYTTLYTYADRTISPGTALPSYNIQYSGAATGNSTIGIFAYGSSQTYTCIYNYITNIVTNGTVLSTALEFSAAAGNSTIGVFATGNDTTTTNLYNYSADAVSIGTALSTGVYNGTAAGNSTVGVFTTGNGTTTTNLYYYADNTVALGTILTQTSNTNSVAAGNSKIGIFGTNTTTDTYDYVASTCIAQGFLSQNPSYGAGTSNGNAGITL